MVDTSGRPNFFIVGAPKCGTTSLYEYLRQHNKRAGVTSGDVIHARLKGFFREYAPWMVSAKTFVPSEIKNIYRYVLGRMSGSIKDRPVDAAFLASLSDMMAPGIENLSRLLDRNLDHWLLKYSNRNLASNKYH